MKAKSEFGLEVSVFCARYGLSLKELAAEAGVNPNTMQRALAQLEQVGLAEANRTAGRLVTQDEGVIEAARREEAQGIMRRYLESMNELGYSPQEAVELLKEEEI